MDVQIPLNTFTHQLMQEVGLKFLVPILNGLTTLIQDIQPNTTTKGKITYPEGLAVEFEARGHQSTLIVKTHLPPGLMLVMLKPTSQVPPHENDWVVTNAYTLGNCEATEPLQRVRQKLGLGSEKPNIYFPSNE